MNSRLPRFAKRFLEWYCPASLYEGIEGDLTEQFEEDVVLWGEKRARRKFTINVLLFFRPSIVFRNRLSINFIQTYMLTNYIKIAFRSLWRSKMHSLINILGLGLAIASCVLISLYVRDEVTFDRFHSKGDRIYRAYAREDWGENQQFFNTVTPFPMGPALKDNLQEVEYQVRILNSSVQLKVEGQAFNQKLALVGKDFFKVFDFKMTEGNGDQALSGQNNVVISERLATRYFGNTNPIGKVISIQLRESFEDFFVKAVTENPPINSSIQYDIVISDLNFTKTFGDRALHSWFNVSPETYVLLAKGADVKEVENKFPPIFRTALGEEDFKKSKYQAGLQPLLDIHLNSNFPTGIAPVGNLKYSLILSAIALLILVVACINFVTLSVGRSLKRAKEVGIRKVVGAQRRQLVAQFIGEAVLVTFFALVGGLLLAILNLPMFNDLSGKQLSISVDQFVMVFCLLLVLVIGIIAGSYPAFVLSSFQPVSILKGILKGSSRQGMRKALVGVQLMLSIFLVSSSLLMKQQFSFIQNKNMGFEKEQLVEVQMTAPRTGRLSEKINKGFEKIEQFKTELAKYPDITALCGSAHDFGNGAWTKVGYTDTKGTYREFAMNIIDDEYIPALKMEMKQGRNFSDNNTSDKRRGVIINEAFAKEYGWKDAVGMKIPGKGFPDHEIIGVVKDFNFASLYTKVQPLAMVQDPLVILEGIENIDINNSPIPKLMLRIKPGNMANTLDQVKETWTKLNGEEEFKFSFVDQAMAKQYSSDQNLGKIVSIATLMAMFIACLGLYALASLAMQNRTKEISIRKVMGATDNSLLVLLSKEYVYLIALSLAVSVPVTWYLMRGWLSSFEYRINIGPNVFLLAGGISLLIAIATISFQIFKTVRVNPAKNLKYE